MELIRLLWRQSKRDLVIAGLLCASTVHCRLEQWAVMARFVIVLRSMNRGELFSSG